MSSISYRQLDANGDPRWGQGQADFVSDLTATAQAVLTRVRLLLAEWYQDLGDGLPLWQNILGTAKAQRNLQANTLLIVNRILGTPNVISVSNVDSTFNSGTRTMTFSCRVQTRFGQISVTNRPQPPSRSLPNFGD